MKLPVEYDKLKPAERKLIREKYVRIQKGNCFYCNAPLDGDPAEEIKVKPIKKKYYPEGFFDALVHLHHDHNTGMTLGAVHCHCNAVLWEYEGK